jgi:hypothetical protein
MVSNREKMKAMEKARAKARETARGGKGGDPTKFCPICGMSVKDLNEKNRLLHIDRCLG